MMVHCLSPGRRCSLDVGNEDILPLHGACLLIALRRSPLDRYAVSHSLHRKVHFADSREAVLKALEQYRTVCFFPETKPGLYGGVRVPSSRFEGFQKTGVPVIAVSAPGIYDCLPPYETRLRKSKVTVSFRSYPPGEAEKAYRDLVETERRYDISSRARRIIRKSRNMRRLLYVCPHCGRIGALDQQGKRSLECRNCRRSWTLLCGKGLLETPGGRVIPLAYVEDLMVRYESDKGGQTPEFSISLAGRKPGLLIVGEDRLIIATQGEKPAAFVFSKNDVESIRTVGKERLKVTCLQGDNKHRFLFQTTPEVRSFLLRVLARRLFSLNRKGRLCKKGV
ncbi:MAG: hypothetical protein JW760_00310 [Spirochaetales bacterium]|nr:hypothetical protein [Spirochaetales bacterium]